MVAQTSGIQNKAFWLLAAGGTHHGVTVPAIGRINAERIFYRTLYKIGPAATFTDVRRAAILSAYDLFGYGTTYYFATMSAWDAVGVPR